MWDSREVRSVSFGLVLGVREAYNRAFALGVVSFSFCFPWGFFPSALLILEDLPHYSSFILSIRYLTLWL
jgi:hypothetical protein